MCTYVCMYAGADRRGAAPLPGGHGYICICMCRCMFIYIYRERERYMHAYIDSTYINVYI